MMSISELSWFANRNFLRECSRWSKVVTRYTAKGTHQGELFGIAATGKPLTMTALVLQRVVSGKIQESWLELDMLGLMQQMGAIPAPGEGGE